MELLNYLLDWTVLDRRKILKICETSKLKNGQKFCLSFRTSPRYLVFQELVWCKTKGSESAYKCCGWSLGRGHMGSSCERYMWGCLWNCRWWGWWIRRHSGKKSSPNSHQCVHQQPYKELQVADQEKFLTTSDNEEDEVLNDNYTTSSHDDTDDDDEDINFSAVTKRNEQDLRTRIKAKPADARNIFCLSLRIQLDY